MSNDRLIRRVGKSLIWTCRLCKRCRTKPAQTRTYTNSNHWRFITKKTKKIPSEYNPDNLREIGIHDWWCLVDTERHFDWILKTGLSILKKEYIDHSCLIVVITFFRLNKAIYMLSLINLCLLTGQSILGPRGLEWFCLSLAHRIFTYAIASQLCLFYKALTPVTLGMNEHVVIMSIFHIFWRVFLRLIFLTFLHLLSLLETFQNLLKITCISSAPLGGNENTHTRKWQK